MAKSKQWRRGKTGGKKLSQREPEGLKMSLGDTFGDVLSQVRTVDSSDAVTVLDEEEPTIEDDPDLAVTRKAVPAVRRGRRRVAHLQDVDVDRKTIDPREQLRQLQVQFGVERHQLTKQISELDARAEERLAEVTRLRRELETASQQVREQSEVAVRVRGERRELAEEADELRTRLSALEVHAAGLEQEVDRLRDEAHSSHEDADGAKMRVLFVTLVATEVASWCSRHERFEARFIRFEEHINAARADALFRHQALCGEIQEAEDLSATKTFRSNEENWDQFMTQARHARESFLALQKACSELERLIQERAELIALHTVLKEEARQLHQRIVRLVRVYEEISLNIWDVTAQDPGVLRLLDASSVDMQVVLNPITVPVLEKILSERYVQVTKHLLPPGPKKGGRRRKKATVHFGPGQLFSGVTDRDREISYLCLLALSAWGKQGVPIPPDHRDIYAVLVGASVIRPSEQEAWSRSLEEILQGAVLADQVSPVSKEHPDTQILVAGFRLSVMGEIRLGDILMLMDGTHKNTVLRQFREAVQGRMATIL